MAEGLPDGGHGGGFVIQAWHIIAGGLTALMTGLFTGRLQIKRTEGDIDELVQRAVTESVRAVWAVKEESDRQAKNEIVQAVQNLERSIIATLSRIHAETGAGIQVAIREVAQQHGDVKSDTRVILREVEALRRAIT